MRENADQNNSEYEHFLRSAQVKKNVNDLEIWRKSLIKKSSLLQLSFLHQSTVGTGSITNKYKTYFSNMPQDSLFLHLTCLKSSRST